ncbi:hypothetical protein I3F59_015505 [Streptomyces sp. MUM 178J]|nr:hypothetical protein [Streptomyces sp. MUM 178J]WRQ80652.1 hypothetical protein I3F59_015505 [Streptomyces sp. MUM 178J]
MTDDAHRGDERRPTVEGLQRTLADFAAARSWQSSHTPKNPATALSVEASELVEIFQWLTPEESAGVMRDEAAAHRVRDEVADVSDAREAAGQQTATMPAASPSGRRSERKR